MCTYSMGKENKFLKFLRWEMQTARSYVLQWAHRRKKRGKRGSNGQEERQLRKECKMRRGRDLVLGRWVHTQRTQTHMCVQNTFPTIKLYRQTSYP